MVEEERLAADAGEVRAAADTLDAVQSPAWKGVYLLLVEVLSLVDHEAGHRPSSS